ncbi:hypothetical protein, partial [Nocardia wallacei]|uniref:hypothetical protein n=1 Tax=Nocardia wallacei TaxID=480035 RepID=UPI002458859E
MSSVAAVTTVAVTGTRAAWERVVMNAAGQLVASARAGVRRRLVCYFALACGLSWLWLVPLMV